MTRPRSTHFSELATAPQFAGVLHQLARRMRGIEPDSKAFKAALARVRSDMADRYARRPEQALYHRSGALADGRSAATVKRYADGAGLDGLGAREVQEILAREYVPANAALSLAGDFGGLPVAALLEREFGGIPPGLPAVAPAPGEPDTLRSDLPWPGISEPAGVVALRAPALSDTLHPSFYATTLTLGSLLTTRWQRPPPPLVSRFQYAILEDPDVARFYPPPAAEVPGVEGLIYEYATAVSEARVVHIDDGERQRIWRAVDWVLGGPVPPELQERMRTDPGALQTLCSGAALRELSGGEGFWAEYRRRFRDAAPSVAAWTERFLDPAWLVALRLVPKP